MEKEGSYFTGELVVQKNYESLYGEKIKSWFIRKVLKEAGLSKKREAKNALLTIDPRKSRIRLLPLKPKIS